MNLEIIFKLLTLLQFIAASQNSHVQEAKHHIRAEVRSALGTHRYYGSPPSHAHKRINHHHHHHHPNRNHNHHHQRQGPHVHRLHTHPHPHRWSSGRQGRHAVEHHHFTAWTAWSVCSDSGNGHGNGNGHSSGCIKRRERFCKVKRKCGHTKHVEERKCWGCTQPEPVWHLGAHYEPPPPPQQPVILHQPSDTPHSIIINAAAAAVGGGQQQPVTVVTATATSTDAPPTAHGHQIRMPVLEEIVVEPGSHGHSQSHHHYPHVITAAGDEYPGLSEPEEEESGERDDAGAEDDFFVINARSKFRRQPRPIFIDSTDYSDLAAEDHDGLSGAVWPASRKRAVPVQAMRMRNHRSKLQQRRAHGRALRQGSSSSSSSDDGVEGDVFQYEDFDFDPEVLGRGGAAGTGGGGGVGVGVGTGGGGGAGVNGASYENQYSESYEDLDYGNTSWATQVAPSKEKATPDALIPRHRRIYSKWSRWTKCSPKCTTRRYKKCRVKEQCGREVLREIAYCYTEGSFCQQWLQAQMQKSPAYELRPVTAAKRRDISFGTQSNAIVGDYIMNGKGYRGPEYTPMKLKCGIAGIRSNKRNMYNMLKIIGGKAARKGEWPWQVAIINRFKEAFCGGTLIAPQWVLTAAHCVRKVLYVRIGEHNLDYGDGTEFQMRVLKSFKHPSFDKKTVDSDVALLKLPKPVNATTWVGFSCLPRPYQPLPKNVDCTVIGWGKRRNRDVAGTSVLHQAEVPIIPMDNCRSVYHDYTITKNMFCAGHKRGRIDTCAGDSGGPLLCRDSTKPNHPWTIFGITSFGDGCAKRNKFGIYAKVPNYVDWVWSVINCNGNCKLYQRGYSD